MACVIKIQRWIKNKVNGWNFFGLKQRVNATPLLQRYLRGYLAHKKVSFELYSKRLHAQTDELQQIFEKDTEHIKKTIAVAVTYMWGRLQIRRAAAAEQAKYQEKLRLHRIEIEKKKKADEKARRVK